MVNCIDSMFFGRVSGSAIADISSTGSIMIPMMVRKGYDREFATAITVASATQGIITPPSHNMVIYAMVAGGVSVRKTTMERVSVAMLSLWPAMLLVLFLTTYVPQLTMALPGWLMP